MSLDAALDKLSLEDDQRAAVRQVIEASASDTYGDGDQSPIPSPDDPDLLAMRAIDSTASAKARMRITMPLRSARMTGLDSVSILHDVDSDTTKTRFHAACFMGCISQVRSYIEAARKRQRAGDDMAMTHLLETRISLVRASPLHYACLGALTMKDSGCITMSTNVVLRYEDVVRELVQAGARIDPYDICGYTPLAYVASMEATSRSIHLIPVLVSLGADPNSRCRFGEVVITDCIIGENAAAFQAMLDVGADLDAKDDNGVTVLVKATAAPNLGQAWVVERRKKALGAEACDACGKKGVSKFCSKCRKVYYCSKSCQVQAWRSGHKQVCGKERPGAEFLDIDTRTMIMPHVSELNGGPIEMCSVTGSRSSKAMTPRQVGTPFNVGVFLMIDPKGRDPIVAIVDKTGGFMRLQNSGDTRGLHDKLEDVISKNGENTRSIYVLAKWLRPAVASRSRSKRSHVLRLDLSKFLPPPKALW